MLTLPVWIPVMVNCLCCKTSFLQMFHGLFILEIIQWCIFSMGKSWYIRFYPNDIPQPRPTVPSLTWLPLWLNMRKFSTLCFYCLHLLTVFSGWFYWFLNRDLFIVLCLWEWDVWQLALHSSWWIFDNFPIYRVNYCCTRNCRRMETTKRGALCSLVLKDLCSFKVFEV